MDAAVQHPPTTCAALRFLDPAVRRWFLASYRQPTLAQRLAWPRIAGDESLLLCAPTGSGKTWAAVLPLLHHWQPGAVCCLYLAPLRALCNDLYFRLAAAFAELGEQREPLLRAGLLTGDVPQHRRKRLWSSPPQLLVTTPESLALLLARPDAADRLGSLRTVIVDEAHALAGSKRGADLSLCLERVDELTHRPVQRLGLSATVSPRRRLAQWLRGSGPPMAVAVVPDTRPWQMQLHHLGEAAAAGSFLSTFLDHLEEEVSRHRTTLLFTNARSTAERVTWALRRRRPDLAEQIAIHHGSLAADQRAEVEARLQAGSLRLVVSSTSLELGVDLGFVDQVLMLHPPGGAARLLQRLGRAGHRPGGRRQGALFTTALEELWEAVVTRDAGQLEQLEPLRLVSHPLDVLCQHLVGLVVARPRTAAELWSLVRRADSYRSLSLLDFVRCLEYLTGGKDAQPVPARLAWEDHRLRLANRRIARLFRQNTGTITTEAQTEILLGDGRVLGSLNTHWADRLEPGSRFLLGGHSFQVRRKVAGALEVEARGGTPAFSRWLGGTSYLSPELADRIWHLRVRLKLALQEGDARRLLVEEYRLEEPLAELLLEQAQMQETVSEIPAADLLVESWPSDDSETAFHAFHLPFTPAMGEALGKILAARLNCGPNPGIITGRLGFILAAGAEVPLDPDRLRRLLTVADLDRALDRAFADSIILRLKFGEVVKTGLMLLRQPFGRGHKVGGLNWAGDRLLHWLRFAQPDFPLLLQAQRELREEVYHAERIRAWLADLPRRGIRQRWLREASPFAREWFFNPFQPPLHLAEPSLDAALHRIHREQRTEHAPA